MEFVFRARIQFYKDFFTKISWLKLTRIFNGRSHNDQLEGNLLKKKKLEKRKIKVQRGLEKGPAAYFEYS